MKNRGFFNDEDGSLSMSRLLAFFLVASFICMAGIVTAQKEAIPDIPIGWAGLVTGLYFTNKAAPVAKKIWGKQDEQKTEDPKPEGATP